MTPIGTLLVGETGYAVRLVPHGDAAVAAPREPPVAGNPGGAVAGLAMPQDGSSIDAPDGPRPTTCDRCGRAAVATAGEGAGAGRAGTQVVHPREGDTARSPTG